MFVRVEILPNLLLKQDTSITKADVNEHRTEVLISVEK